MHEGLYKLANDFAHLSQMNHAWGLEENTETAKAGYAGWASAYSLAARMLRESLGTEDRKCQESLS